MTEAKTKMPLVFALLAGMGIFNQKPQGNVTPDGLRYFIRPDKYSRSKYIPAGPNCNVSHRSKQQRRTIPNNA